MGSLTGSPKTRVIWCLWLVKEPNGFCWAGSEGIMQYYIWVGASLMAQMMKNLPAMQEIWAQSLGREDPLEKRMATHSGILAWRIPWTE